MIADRVGILSVSMRGQTLTMGRVERDREIARRRKRRAKVAKLRKSYNKASRAGEKNEILEKARRISPFVSFEEPAEAK